MFFIKSNSLFKSFSTNFASISNEFAWNTASLIFIISLFSAISGFFCVSFVSLLIKYSSFNLVPTAIAKTKHIVVILYFKILL